MYTYLKIRKSHGFFKNMWKTSENSDLFCFCTKFDFYRRLIFALIEQFKFKTANLFIFCVRNEYPQGIMYQSNNSITWKSQQEIRKKPISRQGYYATIFFKDFSEKLVAGRVKKNVGFWKMNNWCCRYMKRICKIINIWYFSFWPRALAYAVWYTKAVFFWETKFSNIHPQVFLSWAGDSHQLSSKKLEDELCIFKKCSFSTVIKSKSLQTRNQSIFNLIRLDDGTTIWSSRRLMVQWLFG